MSTLLLLGVSYIVRLLIAYAHAMGRARARGAVCRKVLGRNGREVGRQMKEHSKLLDEAPACEAMARL